MSITSMGNHGAAGVSQKAGVLVVLLIIIIICNMHLYKHHWRNVHCFLFDIHVIPGQIEFTQLVACLLECIVENFLSSQQCVV